MLNFGQICRLCLLEVRNNLNIFESTDPVCSLSARIMALAEVEMAEGDMMPHLICLSCYSKVEQYHVFKAQIEKSDSILRQELVKSTALESGAQPITELAATENLADGNACLQLLQPNARLDTVGQVHDICPLRAAQRGLDDVGNTEEIIIKSEVSPVALIKSEEINVDRLHLSELNGSNCEVKNSGRTIGHQSSDITAAIGVCSSCGDENCLTSDNCNQENGCGVSPFIRSPDNYKDEGGCDDFVFEVVVFSQNDEATSKDSLSEQDIADCEANAQLNPTMVSSTKVYKDDIKCTPNTNVADISLFIEDDPSASFHCGACKKVFTSHFHLARHKEQAHPNIQMFSSITACKDDTKVELFSQKDQAQNKDSSSEADTADEDKAQLNPFHPIIIPSITTCKDDTKVVVFSSQNDRTPNKDFPSEQDIAAQDVNFQLNPVHPTIVSGIKDEIVVFSQNDQAPSKDSSREQHIVAHVANAQLSPTPPTIDSNITTYKGDTMAIPNTNVTDIPSFIKDDPSALFPCDLCKKVFMSHFYLAKHTEQAHQKPRLECDVCKINFSSKYTLRAHKGVHTDDQLYRCAVCPETYKKSSQLSAHKLAHKQRFVCKLCGMTFIERKIYIEHRIKHKGEMTHVCTDCNKAFADKTALYLHSTIHSVDKRHYTCPDCGDLFYQRSYLVRHHKRRHRKTNSSATNASTLNTGGQDCNGVENSPNILEDGEGAVKKISSNVDTMSDTKTSINIGYQNRAFACHICGKRAASKIKMASHMRVHTGERPYKCDLCPKAYKEIGHLTYHFMSQHEKLSFKCNLCEKIFRTSVSFSQHQARHGAVKTHVCAHCKRAFYSDYELEIHMLTHTELKSYKCKECGALLRTKRYFEHHFRSFHKGVLITYPYPDPSDYKFSIPATEEDLTCVYCGKRFSCRSKVIDHTRIHTGERPYVCNICHKAYTQQGHLREHSRSVHDNVVSPYCCDTCGALFKVRTTFQLHQLKHDGVKTHICTLCNKAFYTSYLLKRHVRAMHEKRFSCQFCDRLFHSKSVLVRHFRQLHKVKISKVEL